MQLNTYKDDAYKFNTFYGMVMSQIKLKDVFGTKTLTIPYLPLDAEALLKQDGFNITRVTDARGDEAITITW